MVFQAYSKWGTGLMAPVTITAYVNKGRGRLFSPSEAMDE